MFCRQFFFYSIPGHSPKELPIKISSSSSQNEKANIMAVRDVIKPKRELCVSTHTAEMCVCVCVIN